MTTQIKICGMNSPEAVDAAVEAGATHIGFVHFEKSPRHVDLRTATELRRRLPKTVKAVLVQVNMQPEPIARAIETIEPDVVQFHGQETPEWMKLVREAAELETWRAVGLREKESLERARQFEGACDRLLFDSPAKALPGGNGTAFPWGILEGWEPFMPWALAGGLTPSNVRQAVEDVRPPLVDVVTGVELEPGRKSLHLIRAFCEAVQHADAKLAEAGDTLVLKPSQAS